MFKIIISDITNYMGIYFGRSILLGVVCALILFGILTFLRKKNKYDGSKTRIKDKTLAFFFGIVYGYMVVGITFLCREPVFDQVISFIPFSSPLGNARLLAYFFENIIMFIPYGFIMPVLFGYFEKWNRCLLLGILSSIAIEASQFITARGKAQVDDVPLNSAGMMVGWVAFTVVAHLYRTRKKKEDK